MGSVIHIDSFDWYTTAADGGWTVSGNAGITGARNGNGIYAGGNWQAGTDGSARRDFPASISEIITGFALRSTRLSTENIYWGTSAVNHIYCGWNAGALQFFRGDGTSLGTTSSVWTANTDKYLEVWIKVHDSTGFLKVNVNGTQEINFSGDTRNGGNAEVSRLTLAGGQITFEGLHYLTIDDLYVIDNTDGASSPLGDSKVECDFPSGNGNSSQFTGNDGNSTDNYLLVDETAPNSDTDYVQSATVSQKDTYATSDLASATGVVHAVQVNAYAKKTDAGARSIATVARASGSESDSADITLSTSYVGYRKLYTTKPGGGSWDISDVNAAEFGVKVTV